MIKGMRPQTIIQGKSYALRLRFGSIDLQNINKIWFSCSQLGLLKEMKFDGIDTYSFELSWEETQALNPCITTFNITVQFIGSEKKRDLANGVQLSINKNLNPVPKEE